MSSIEPEVFWMLFRLLNSTVSGFGPDDHPESCCVDPDFLISRVQGGEVEYTLKSCSIRLGVL